MKDQSKHQWQGALGTIITGAVLALLVWGASRLQDENTWDSESVLHTMARDDLKDEFEDYVAQNNQTLMDLKATRLRTELRSISKELRRLEGKGVLNDSDEALKEVLEAQLDEVQQQREALILSDPY